MPFHELVQRDHTFAVADKRSRIYAGAVGSRLKTERATRMLPEGCAGVAVVMVEPIIRLYGLE